MNYQEIRKHSAAQSTYQIKERKVMKSDELMQWASLEENTPEEIRQKLIIALEGIVDKYIDKKVNVSHFTNYLIKWVRLLYGRLFDGYIADDELYMIDPKYHIAEDYLAEYGEDWINKISKEQLHNFKRDFSYEDLVDESDITMIYTLCSIFNITYQ